MWISSKTILHTYKCKRGEIKNRMKIEIICRQKSVSLQAMDNRQDLELLSLPVLDAEFITFILVFRKGFLSWRFRTTASVKVDCRSKSLKKSFGLRVSCGTCPWSMWNRMDYIHESKVMQNLNDEDGQSRRVISEKTIQLCRYTVCHNLDIVNN